MQLFNQAQPHFTQTKQYDMERENSVQSTLTSSDYFLSPLFVSLDSAGQFVWEIIVKL